MANSETSGRPGRPGPGTRKRQGDANQILPSTIYLFKVGGTLGGGDGLISAMFPSAPCWFDMGFQLWGFKIIHTPSNVKE